MCKQCQQNPKTKNQIQTNCGVQVALGITGKSSTTYNHQIARSERYRIQNTIAALLIREGQKMHLQYADDFHLTAQCLRKPYYASSVGINKSKEHGVAFYTGTQRCGSPWACPICSAQIQEVRRQEIAQAFDWSYKTAHKKVIMVTFTFPHVISDFLKEQILGLTQAFKYLRAGNVWTLMKKRVGFDGLIRSLEVMHGSSGWHSHTHEAWIVDVNVDVSLLKEWLLKRWWDVCVKAGLIDADYAKTNSFADHAVQITDNCKSSDYLAKQDKGHWGADRELAKANVKGTVHSDKKTIHPFELAKKFEDDDDIKAGELFVEYVAATKGKAQIYWSQGLKAKVGLKDRKDIEIVEAQEDKADLLAILVREDWRLVVRKKVRAELLDAAEANGYDGIVKFLEVLRE